MQIMHSNKIKCYVPYFIIILCTYFLVSFLICVLPVCLSRLLDYLRLTCYLNTQQLLYVLLCHVTDTFLFCINFLIYISFYLSLLLMTPLHCTTYALPSSASMSLILCILTCYLTAHLRVYSQSTYMFTLLTV